jgi:hypothetical protein
MPARLGPKGAKNATVRKPPPFDPRTLKIRIPVENSRDQVALINEIMRENLPTWRRQELKSRFKKWDRTPGGHLTPVFAPGDYSGTDSD